MITHNVTGCRDCVFRDFNRNTQTWHCMGENQKDGGEFLREIPDTGTFPITPDWCPLITDSITIQLIKNE